MPSNNRVEIISRKRVKPSSPTSSDLETFTLSLWDQGAPHVYPPVIFFYPPPDSNTKQDIVAGFCKKSLTLEKALSDTLVHYYPLAGEVTDGSPNVIRCNDEGVYWIEARLTDCDLRSFLSSDMDAKSLNDLTPNIVDPEFDFRCTLATQISMFKCGGAAITVCVSHKIMDASSLLTFIRSWTTIAFGEPSRFVPMDYVSIDPPKVLLGLARARVHKPGTFGQRRILFSASKIAKLKAKFNQRVSSVDVVVGLILKTAIRAANSLVSDSRPLSEQFVLFQLANLRSKMATPVPESTIGNILWSVPVKLTASDSECDELPVKIRKTLQEFYADNASIAKVMVDCKPAEGATSFICSSLTRLPLYDIDFGWGKPLWVTNVAPPVKNFILLMGTRSGDGSIEAWVSLGEKEIREFECDDELLLYATLNRPVCC